MDTRTQLRTDARTAFNLATEANALACDLVWGSTTTGNMLGLVRLVQACSNVKLLQAEFHDFDRALDVHTHETSE
jgi:hypothetical protein